MKTRIALVHSLIVILLGYGLLFPVLPAAAQAPIAPEGNLGCVFGYTLVSGLDFATQWIDIHTTGTQVNFQNPPDDKVATVNDIGFSFPFFENKYSSVNVSTNGFLTFNQYLSAFPANYSIPMEFLPNNIIAGLWDDLTVGGTFNSGKVFYKTFPGADPYIVFEWYQVTRLGSTDPLTFEIVLHQNGDIYLNYASLSGVLNQATVGIEDSDGVDGYMLVNDAPFLASNTSYKLVFPTDGARVKAKPLYQGGFLANGLVDLPLTIVNTGTSPDSFHFQATIIGTPDGQVKIVSDTGAYLANTPVLDPSQSFSARIRVTAAKTGAVGLKWSGTITAISNTNSDRRFVVSFDASTPAPFAAFYIDANTAYTRYYSKELQVQSVRLPNFTNASYSIARLPGPKYLLTWEERGVGAHGPYKNIKRAIASSFTGFNAPVANVTDNSGLTQITFDESPQVAIAPNGTIGMAFVRSTPNTLGDQFNANIYFARLDPNGNLVPGSILNLTKSTTWYGDLALNHPNITATSQNSFVITYETLTPLEGMDAARDIDLAVVDTSGTVLQTPHHLTDSQGTGLINYASSSAVLQNGNVLLAFLGYLSGQPNQVKYTLYHPADNTLDAFQTISESSAEGPRLETLAGGNILLSWVKNGSLGIRYVVFNSSGVIQGSPLELASPNGWKIEQVSLAPTIDGNLAFFWRDAWGMYLYYALVDPNGSVVTSPMPFLRGSDPAFPLLLNNTTGKRIAPFIAVKYTFSPLARK